MTAEGGRNPQPRRCHLPETDRQLWNLAAGRRTVPDGCRQRNAPCKTGKKPIYLSAAALAVLNGVPRTKGNPFIVPGEKRRKAGERKSEPAPRADLKRPWAAISKAAGLTDVRIHDSRHSFVSMGAGASLGLPIIGKLLGHTQPATTARYSHLDADPIRHAADIIGNRIAAAMAGNSADVIQHPAMKSMLYRGGKFDAGGDPASR